MEADLLERAEKELRSEMLDTQQLRILLKSLYEEQLRISPNDYIRYHSSDQAIASHANSFLRYCEFLPESGRILDWGCQHAPDACMVRATFGAKLSLVGSDFPTGLPANYYPVFWDYCGLEFVPLSDNLALPFDNNSFDCVIGAGVLEHVAMDYESLKELYRVLKPDGRLIITNLPNRFSYAEFMARNFRKSDFHSRLYTISKISSMLKSTGFYPLTLQRHHFLPSNHLKSVTRLLSRYERRISRVWPLGIFSAALLAVAQKVHTMR
jgi:ubiquinone/menaquinone biosynthesis C-methylase UbiE